MVPFYYTRSSGCGKLRFLRRESFSLSPENFKIITNYFTYMHKTQAIYYVTLMIMAFGCDTVLCGKCVSLKIACPSIKLQCYSPYNSPL
jgi:hypothetical protein